MKHSYTFNYLIKYLYGEQGILQKLEIENQIEESHATRREFLRLKKAFQMLPRISFSPSEESVSTILDYSKRSQLNPSC